jgi:hypothetical protein
MSNNSNSVTTESNSNSEQNVEFVPKKAFEDVTKDMHKYKSGYKEAVASVNEYQAKLKAIEEEKMREENRWKELYENKNQELEIERKKLSEKEKSVQKSIKLSALKTELGGKIKDQYLVHAQLDAIEFKEDGSIDFDSLQKVANDFRKEHGQLIPSNVNANITGNAAPTDTTLNKPKDLKSMSFEEKIQALKELEKQKPVSTKKIF